MFDSWPLAFQGLVEGKSRRICVRRKKGKRKNTAWEKMADSFVCPCFRGFSWVAAVLCGRVQECKLQLIYSLTFCFFFLIYTLKCHYYKLDKWKKIRREHIFANQDLLRRYFFCLKNKKESKTRRTPLHIWALQYNANTVILHAPPSFTGQWWKQRFFLSFFFYLKQIPTLNKAPENFKS